jgi:hypothetical protein
MKPRKLWLMIISIMAITMAYYMFPVYDVEPELVNVKSLGWDNPMKCPEAIKWQEITEEETTWENTEEWVYAIDKCRIQLYDYKKELRHKIIMRGIEDETIP